MTYAFSSKVQLCSSQLTTVSDSNGGLSLARVRAVALNLLDNIHAFCHTAEDAVLAVQPRSGDSAQEKLAATCSASEIQIPENVWHVEKYAWATR